MFRSLATSIPTVLAMLCTIAGCAQPPSGILVMAHGGDAAWNRAVDETVAPLRRTYPVEIAFGMARPSTIRDAVRRLEAQGVRRIAVVRMFIAGESFLEPTEFVLGLRKSCPHSNDPDRGGSSASSHMEPLERIASRATFVVSRQGVADSPLVDQILFDRVRALSTDPRQESVLILAHGPGDDAENERWLARMRLRAQRIHELGRFRHVHCETLREDWPARRAEAQRRIRQYVKDGSKDGGRVIVVPFRIAGFGPYSKVLAGLDYVADRRGFCPHANMTRWIESTARQCLADG